MNSPKRTGSRTRRIAGYWSLMMVSKTLFVVVYCLLLFGCAKQIPDESMASEAQYPKELKYDSTDRRYVGVPELELRSERNGFLPDDSIGSIDSFNAAYGYAYMTLSERFSAELIEEQLPLLIDYENGNWIVSGSLRSSESGSVVTGGTAEIAFTAQTGEVLYIVHSL